MSHSVQDEHAGDIGVTLDTEGQESILEQEYSVLAYRYSLVRYSTLVGNTPHSQQGNFEMQKQKSLYRVLRALNAL